MPMRSGLLGMELSGLMVRPEPIILLAVCNLFVNVSMTSYGV